MIVGRALKPTVVDDSPAIEGDAIVRPWKKARKLSFIVTAGAMTTGDALTMKVQARVAATAAWEDLQSDAATPVDIVFPAAKIADTGAIESNVVFGSLDLTRIEDTYDALRLHVVNGVAQNVTVAAVYVLTDLYAVPQTDIADDLWSQQRP